MKTPLSLALGLCCMGALAQDKFAALGPGNKSCPKLNEIDTTLSRGGSSTGASTGGQIIDTTKASVTTGGTQYFAKGNRRDVSAFAVSTQEGKTLRVSQFKGKIVLVGLWQTTCDPSKNLLMELASIVPQGGKFGFEVWTGVMDSENTQATAKLESGSGGRWGILRAFVQKNGAFFKDGAGKNLPLYAPGLGKEGPSVFLDSLPSLPAFFIIDREGKLAYQSFEYEPNMVAQNLTRVLREGAPTPAAAPAQH
jgi:hypothetical protein